MFELLPAVRQRYRDKGESGSATECWPGAEAQAGKHAHPGSGKEAGGAAHPPHPTRSPSGLALAQVAPKQSKADGRPTVLSWKLFYVESCDSKCYFRSWTKTSFFPQRRAPRRFHCDFHRLKYRFSRAVLIRECREYADLRISLISQKHSIPASAPFPLHGPVNGLHLIEIAGLTNWFFLLTKKIEGVQQDRSLTVSEVFPVGAESGAQAKSPEAEGRSET